MLINSCTYFLYLNILTLFETIETMKIDKGFVDNFIQFGLI